MGEQVPVVVASRASQRGRKKKDRAEICKRIHQTRVADRNNYRTIEEGAGLTPYMIRQLQKEGFLRRALTQTRPLLTEKHKTAEGLIVEVEMAFASTTTSTLNKTFLSVQLIKQSIMRHNGGNAFRLSHIQKGKLLRAGELPDSLSCDPALYWATLAKVVPQSVTTCAPPPSSDFDAFF
ncbi:hypothetical protein DVH05_019934 [Phytophthora capsici]|nr:hypothetical protein DVH05_019934 [Phytophthora capsici]